MATTLEHAQFAHVPPALKTRKQWLVWKFKQVEGEKKPRKIPYYANGTVRKGVQGDDRDRAALVVFDDALRAAQKQKAEGVGFAFLPGDGLVGIDLDGAIDVETGEIQERAQAIVEACASYTELSPSRKGLHILCTVDSAFQSFKSNQIGVEVYCGAQYFTVTGWRWAEAYPELRPLADSVVRRLKATVSGAKTQHRAPPPLVALPGGAGDERLKIESALVYISADLDYDDWIVLGMAIQSALGEAGFGVWDAWSAKGSKYPGAGELQKHWRTFKPGGKTTIATLYKMATQNGWRAPAKPKGDKPLKAIPGSKPAKPKEPKQPKEAKPRAGDGSDGYAAAGRSAFDRMLERFTLIYPSSTAWDAKLGKIVKIEHMVAAFGKGLVQWWLDSDHRKTVIDERVVFDPTETCDPKTHVNLFRGFDVKPDSSKSCQKLLALLHYLCGEDEAVYAWVLRWCAYPLQHQGAKMQTAVVMYGEEGAGKNIFWGAITDIYGRHGGIITQMQLQSQFNDWLSAKCFLVANEVVTRQEMTHHVGNLKNLVTEKKNIPINPKNLPLRYETNFANLVFLSNELQPLKINKGDRRYQVIRTPAIRDPEYYRAVALEVADGGIAALYAYLLELDLGDFDEHAKPIMTEAKHDLIELGMTSTQLFWQDLHEGLLPLPYTVCFGVDLYKAYLRWCAEFGEKMPTKINRFSQEFTSMNGVRRRTKRVPHPAAQQELLMDRSKVRKRTMFIVGDAPLAAEQDELAWLKENAWEFNAALMEYLSDGRAKP
jgi:hypothetical protein